MKLRKRPGVRIYPPDSQPHTIAEAFGRQFFDDYDRGVAESAKAQAEKCTEKLGELLQLLHDKGVLDDKDVINFISSYTWERHE